MEFSYSYPFFSFFFISQIKNQFFNKKIVFVISDFKNFFFNLFRVLFNKSKFILFDEGYGTIYSYKKNISQGIYFPIYKYNKTILAIFKVLLPQYYRTLIHSKIKIYSYFYKSINNKNIMKNFYQI